MKDTPAFPKVSLRVGDSQKGTSARVHGAGVSEGRLGRLVGAVRVTYSAVPTATT